MQILNQIRNQNADSDPKKRCRSGSSTALLDIDKDIDALVAVFVQVTQLRVAHQPGKHHLLCSTALDLEKDLK